MLVSTKPSNDRQMRALEYLRGGARKNFRLMFHANEKWELVERHWLFRKPLQYDVADRDHRWQERKHLVHEHELTP